MTSSIDRKQQTSQGLGLPGLEHFRSKDYLYLLFRRRWLICSVGLGIAILVASVTAFIPNTYKATTIILVDPQKVPDTYVPSTVTEGVADRLATLRQQVLSSTRLTQVMDEMKLYADLRNKLTPEELVDRMRKNIEIDVVAAPSSSDHGLGAFKISFQNNSAVQAAQVTNRLASLFIDENVKAREQSVLGTAEFIDRELQNAKKDLAAKEDQIRELKSHYASDLPESQNMHVQAVNSLQLQLQSELDAVNRAQQQKVYFQSQMAESPQVVDLDKNSVAADLIPIQQQLIEAQGQLETLRSRYGPDHPDVLKKSAEVKALEHRIRTQQEESGSAAAPRTPTKMLNPVLQSQISALDQQIKDHEKREADIRTQIEYHQSKLERIPVLEQQLAAVTRDYETAQQHYKLLMDRKFSADMSSSLESYQKGERFVVLDPAEVPEKPFRPDRLLLDIGGLLGGIALAIALAVLLEMFDPTVKTRLEVASLTGASVLAEVPIVVTVKEQRRQKLTDLIGATVSLVAFAGFSILLLATR